MDSLPTLLGLATLLPLASFFIIFTMGPKLGRSGAYIAVAAIMIAGVLSFICLGIWCKENFPEVVVHGGQGPEDGDEGGAEEKDHDGAEDEKNDAENDSDDSPSDDEPAGNDAADTDADADAVLAKDESAEGDNADDKNAEDDGAHAARGPPEAVTATYWVLGKFGDLQLTISCYIDGLTILMFCMVTFIATCIHFYALGYMHDEEQDVTDHEVTLSDGTHLTRPGRFYRFFQYLSLFCFSMLGLVLAGNVAMVFVFWELVGICSYFLIGFYVERNSASTAANKAFIVNRVGDFGFIIGLVALWSTVGTLSFGDVKDGDEVSPGLFSELRSKDNEYALVPSDEMVLASARREVGEEVEKTMAAVGPDVTQEQLNAAVQAKVGDWRQKKGLLGAPYGYWFLIVAGVGIFCGCVGKSAQFPLHVWLPDAMEGPTPVSALVHSATMVAAGVYLVGRFFPLFLPEVLWLIAATGCITLFMAATIAITATDIKRVLAYSTVSQLGYMMLALGLGGWVAGMMHLVTHAFFKSLMFMCSGSVIHAVHSNEMTEMGGLRKKMPITAYTMLVGCLAIAGAGVPVILNVGLSGFYSKDKILEQAFSYMNVNGAPWGAIFFAASAGGAAITAFYMFRMWYMTFAGEPRNQDRYDHAHESPAVMTAPLVVLAVLAVAVAWNPSQAIIGAVLAVIGAIVLAFRAGSSSDESSHTDHAHGHDGHDAHDDDGHGHDIYSEPMSTGKAVLIIGGVLVVLIGIWSQIPVTLEGILEQNRPAGTLASAQGVVMDVVVPDEHLGHAYAIFIGPLATFTALMGFALATFMYGVKYLDPEEVRNRFSGIYKFLRNKWFFDELYDVVFVKNSIRIGKFISEIDKRVIDGFVHWIAAATKWISRRWDQIADHMIVDGSINWVAKTTRRIGVSLKVVQTGSLRQYVMFIVVGTIALFVLLSFFWSPTFAK